MLPTPQLTDLLLPFCPAALLARAGMGRLLLPSQLPVCAWQRLLLPVPTKAWS
jgi:hypothetical protein